MTDRQKHKGLFGVPSVEVLRKFGVTNEKDPDCGDVMTDTEIIRIIAEKVMGWEIVGMGDAMYAGDGDYVVFKSRVEHENDKPVYIAGCMVKDDPELDCPYTAGDGCEKIGGHSVYCLELVPNFLTSDDDCMMAWDRFSDELLTEVVHYGDNDYWGACITYRSGRSIDVENPSRRRAICECMVKAVTETEKEEL